MNGKGTAVTSAAIYVLTEEMPVGYFTKNIKEAATLWHAPANLRALVII
jgi:hypothetical protein